MVTLLFFLLALSTDHHPQETCARILLYRGASKDVKNNNGQTAFQVWECTRSREGAGPRGSKREAEVAGAEFGGYRVKGAAGLGPHGASCPLSRVPGPPHPTPPRWQ